jgi:photosystem II stability/assembly factor-like uncharacterized protein
VKAYASVVGLLFCTLAHGGGWERIETGTSRHLSDIRFVNGARGYAVGDSGTLLKTEDVGKTWVAVAHGFADNFSAISFSGVNNGVVVGAHGSVLWTSNGGDNWNRAIVPDTLTALSDVFLVSATKGYAVGMMGKLRMWVTDDGARTWKLRDSAWARAGQSGPRIKLSSNVTEIFFPSRDTGYVVASQILQTTNGGNAWSVITPSYYDGSTQFKRGHFLSGATGFLCGTYYGEIARTGNGGDSVFRKVIFSAEDVYFPSNQVGYAVTGIPKPAIAKSEDGGNTWFSQAIPSSGGLRRVLFLSTTTGFAVGSNGTLLRTTDGGGAPVKVFPPQRAPARPMKTGGLRLFDTLGRLWQFPHLPEFKTAWNKMPAATRFLSYCGLRDDPI